MGPCMNYLTHSHYLGISSSHTSVHAKLLNKLYNYVEHISIHFHLNLYLICPDFLGASSLSVYVDEDLWLNQQEHQEV